MEEEMFEPDEYPDAEDWDDEYISEEDAAEDCGCYIDDDGNWVPMDEEMEEALFEARAHARAYESMIAELRKKYASGTPEPTPQDQWPEIIDEWKKTKNSNKPWFHLHIWQELVSPEDVEKARDALNEHNFDFDEIFEDDGECALWIESPMGELVNEYYISNIELILNTITIVDDVPYKDGLPAPVYVKYQNALEEYALIPRPNQRTALHHISALKISQKIR